MTVCSGRALHHRFFPGASCIHSGLCGELFLSNDIDVMADGIRNGLGIGRLFEPVWQLQPDRERFIPVMESYWKTYPPVYLYYPKNAGKTKRVKALIDFLISTTGR